MVILTFTFGTVVSMLMPILTAILALASSLAIIRLLSHVATVPSVAPTLATIGLSSGIDSRCSSWALPRAEGRAGAA